MLLLGACPQTVLKSLLQVKLKEVKLRMSFLKQRRETVAYRVNEFSGQVENPRTVLTLKQNNGLMPAS